MNKRKNKYSTYFFSITKILFTIYHIQVIQFNTSHIRNTFITCTWIPSHARIIQHHSNTCPRLMNELKSCKYQSLKCKAVKTYKPKCSWILTSLISTLGGSKFADSKLLTFGNSGSRSAIIHRTVRCSTRLSGVPAEQRLLRDNGRLQRH
jgi:hypothetical protein